MAKRKSKASIVHRAPIIAVPDPSPRSHPRDAKGQKGVFTSSIHRHRVRDSRRTPRGDGIGEFTTSETPLPGNLPRETSSEAGESPKLPREPTPNGAAMGSRKRAALPDPVRARADVADERMLVRERHAPAMADAAESAVERQPARVSRRGRPVSGERPPPGARPRQRTSALSAATRSRASRRRARTTLTRDWHPRRCIASRSKRPRPSPTARVTPPSPPRARSGPAARAHLNPMFRTESPKTEVQTAIAMLQAAEEEKERARRRRRDERVAAKEAKRLAASGAARAARRNEPLSPAPRSSPRHRPARTDSLDSLDATR